MSIWKRLWDFELTTDFALRQRWVPAWGIVTMVVYVVMEVAVLAPATVIGLGAYYDLQARGFAEPSSYDLTQRIFPWLFWILLIFNLSFRIFVGLEGYFVHRRQGLDQGRFWRNLLLYNPAALMTLALHAVLGLFCGLVLWALGMHFDQGFELIMGAGGNLRLWMEAHLPTLLALPTKWMAGLVAVTLYSFLAYFEHWISHRSRFYWHVVHAPHHLPDFLHPLGSPLAYSFDAFFLPIRVLLGAALTKLVYAEPMLLESALVALIWYCFEIFNHSTLHYEFVARHRLLRWITWVGGGHGAYHYLHHSSAQRHQMVNLGAGIGMMWDRIFGTFEEPPTETPAVGWTGNPAVHHNPFRVILGGPARIWYELRHNRGWKTKLKILLGDVEWNPANTIDYIKVEQPKNP